MIKKVLVTQRLELVPVYKEEREMLDASWFAFLSRCGLLPIPVSHRIAPKDYLKALTPDGIVLTGGNDLSVFDLSNELNKKRDTFETELVSLALSHGIPILGVCRGMQLLCQLAGGRLERRPGHVAQTHSISISADARFLTAGPRSVNSYHNFCVLDAGAQFKELARAQDGVLEAMEDSKKALLAIMWHPERNQPYAETDINDFKRFFGSH